MKVGAAVILFFAKVPLKEQQQTYHSFDSTTVEPGSWEVQPRCPVVRHA